MPGIVIASFVVLLLLLFFGIVRGIYPAYVRANHKINTPNGIDQMEMVEIGGIKQALYFRGEDKDNPVILFIHGGPGDGIIQYLHAYQYDWEKDFTIVDWDQRNSGKTLAANDPEAVAATLSGELLLSDAHEVTQYIKIKLGKDKIVVMGQSWGSVLGTMLVQTYPEDYNMYIVTGHTINFADNARVSYERVLNAAREAGNQKDVDALMAIAPYPPATFDESVVGLVMTVAKYQTKYKLAVTFDLGSLIPIFTTPYCTTGELLSVVKGITKLVEYQGDLYRFLFEDYDARNYGTEYKVPIYCLQGENDWQTPYTLSKDFFEEITAPDKKFFTISGAGHATNIDNKAEFTRVLLEELRPLLDK